jgi:hypothetical protein
MKEFNPRGGKFVRRERGGASARKKPNRPGKDSRQKARASRRG